MRCLVCHVTALRNIVGLGCAQVWSFDVSTNFPDLCLDAHVQEVRRPHAEVHVQDGHRLRQLGIQRQLYRQMRCVRGRTPMALATAMSTNA